MTKHQIKKIDSGIRLDNYLLKKHEKMSRSYIKKLIDGKKIHVNGIMSVKSGYKVREGDQVIIDINMDQLVHPKFITLPILYEDNDCIVIDKPEGVLTHSKGEINDEPTVATFIANKLDGLSGNRGGIVHRLDRATSGVIICAKNEKTLKLLQKQFSERKVSKKYIAVAKSGISPKQAVIDIPIGRSTSNPKLFEATSSGKSAQTEYKVIDEGSDYCLVELKPRTGRTHQLRIHLKYLGYPILGDEFYGGKPDKRLFLHAVSLEIKLPNGEKKNYKSNLPKEFHEKIKE
ncbi:RluA family pseudouridine synthase [Candidatus Saccharibacteria bacterium]|nr:RluA family pseudouridine synthase [Candidatus Saccharibacteria bacterium]